ncbi:hypothetical protein VCHA53O466_50096 [Vibrio chagasii]|nr:hypothetical protein VCHA53O466_50096 [Vibrio chagasii]
MRNGAPVSVEAAKKRLAARKLRLLNNAMSLIKSNDSGSPSFQGSFVENLHESGIWNVDDFSKLSSAIHLYRVQAQDVEQSLEDLAPLIDRLMDYIGLLLKCHSNKRDGFVIKGINANEYENLICSYNQCLDY